MILPNNYLTLEKSLFGLGALVLRELSENKEYPEQLWKELKKENKFEDYNQYIYTLNYLYIAGIIDYNKAGEIFNENIKYNSV